jgi:MFS transporter, ACS family, tartrate transporter
LPAILLGVLAFFFLTDWPREARWLTHEQRLWVEQELRGENAVCGKAINIGAQVSPNSAVSFDSFFQLFCNVLLSVLVAYHLETAIGFFRLSRGTHWRSAIRSASLRCSSTAGIRTNRRATVALGCASFHGCGCTVGLLISKPFRAILDSLLQTVVGIGAAYLPTFWAIPTEILSKSSAATAVGLINAIGSISGFAGPYSFGYLHTRSGSLSAGLATMMLAAFAAGLLILLIPHRPRIYIAEAKPIGALLADPTRSPGAI